MDGSTGSGNCVVKIDLNFFSFMGVSTGSGYCFLKIDLYFFSFMDGSIGFGNCFLRIDLYFFSSTGEPEAQAEPKPTHCHSSESSRGSSDCSKSPLS